MINEFNGLKDEVRAVEKKMKKEYLGALGKTEDEITRVKKEIVSLESKLEELQSMVSRCDSTLEHTLKKSPAQHISKLYWRGCYC